MPVKRSTSMNENKQTRAENGRIGKGKSGNPSGRPPGSRNKSTLAVEQLLAGDAEEITMKAIEMAKGGNMAAVRLCLDRLFPAPKQRPVQLELPILQNAADLAHALEHVI